jgi:lysophospholipase L1-like esterase
LEIRNKFGTTRVSIPVMAVVFSFASALFALPSAGEESDNSQHWVGIWGASPDSTGQVFDGQTIRQVLRINGSGRQIRVRFSNELGTQDLVIGAAHIAVVQSGVSIRPETDRVLTFAGQPTVTIAAGAPALSDPVDIDAPDLSSLAVSIFLPSSTGPATAHSFVIESTFISPPGDFTGVATMPIASFSASRFFLTAIYARSEPQSAAIVTLGDSITEGVGSSFAADHRWPDRLAERLAAARRDRALSVVNEGVGGNRVLHDVVGPNAQSRFDRDVLSQPGARFVIFLEGINDIGFAGAVNFVTADQIIAGYQKIIDRAHSHGLKIFAGTLTPFEGTLIPGYFTPEGEVKRETVNTFIRTSGAFDGVIDFEAAVRDPTHPTRMLPAFDSGDHLHPNDAGYQAMANAIDLKLFHLDEDH